MIIDFEWDSPTEEVKKATLELLKSGGGFVHRGYFSQFGPQWAALLGMTRELARADVISRKWMYENTARILKLS